MLLLHYLFTIMKCGGVRASTHTAIRELDDLGKEPYLYTHALISLKFSVLFYGMIFVLWPFFLDFTPNLDTLLWLWLWFGLV